MLVPTPAVLDPTPKEHASTAKFKLEAVRGKRIVITVGQLWTFQLP